MVKKEELLSVLAKRYYHGLYEKILECIKPYILSCEIKRKEHVYRVTNKENKHKNFEILIICKMKEEK